ncbi:hypothetical protein BLNAU_11785 [Blattamonas nauphoetae]|uniref:Uncharacterized protein n=1 Tax=Blattamonas nauphoetae TaxID=2049346 RepID=A0ABQ9WS36_9EUKA|nr:hypothetical protein BLNAU_22793 [Blattamonas nauphoetae]KAK2949629.1 hypothetical protein BLNAU_15489 [Blattamonas nauphoetae]KAK2953322.1 hypothetical protein BLNAU_11785 [Blattamonas nauphoetae]
MTMRGQKNSHSPDSRDCTTISIDHPPTTHRQTSPTLADAGAVSHQIWIGREEGQHERTAKQSHQQLPSYPTIDCHSRQRGTEEKETSSITRRLNRLKPQIH